MTQIQSDSAMLTSLVEWVTNKGRMKFCRPTYRGIFSQDEELAKKTFLKHVDFYVSCVYAHQYEGSG